MMGTSVRALIGAALIWALAIGATASAQTLGRSDVRTSGLQREVQILRPRAPRTPGAVAYDLKRVQRALHQQRIEAPRDPRLGEIEIETRQLRWRADRAARHAPAIELPPTSGLTGGAILEKPRYLGGAHTPSAAPTGSDIGQRVVVLERQATTIERHLAAGKLVAAARLLDGAEADLARLRGAVSDVIANDPNLVALDARLAALHGRLE
jgi:hypothetical protein